jgi:signal transduction histidine kinase
MAKPDRRWWSAPPMIAKYGAAVGSVTAALMSSQWPQIHLTAAPVSLFLCAVMFSAWFGGFRPGLLATALSVLAFKYYFVTPVDSLAVDITEMPRLLIFAVSALFVGALSAAQRRTNEELRTEIKERKHAEEALRTESKRAQEMQESIAREKEMLALQRVAELGRANEALRGCLDALASVPELDDFLGQVMAAMTRQLGALSSTLRIRNFEQNTLPLEIVFQDGRVMSPAEAKYPEVWRNLSIDEQHFALFLDQPTSITSTIDPRSPMPEVQRSYLLGLGIKTIVIIPLTSGGQLNGRLTFRFTEQRDFRPEELEIARALATQASLAIQLTRLAKNARQSAVLEERNQLAGEIHDSLAQFFTGISMQLGAAKEVIQTGGDNGLSYIERATELAQFGLAEARRSAFSLQPSVIEESGLIETLQKLVERSNIPGRLRCNFHSDDVPEETVLPAVRQDLLRIAQEAISNAVRHARPTVISVNVRWDPPNLVLEVIDNGSGIANAKLANGDGFGLSSMRARAENLGAQFDVRTAPGRGTSILVHVPINLSSSRKTVGERNREP